VSFQPIELMADSFCNNKGLAATRPEPVKGLKSC
jgi:hypothetical protein